MISLVRSNKEYYDSFERYLNISALTLSALSAQDILCLQVKMHSEKRWCRARAPVTKDQKLQAVGTSQKILESKGF